MVDKELFEELYEIYKRYFDKYDGELTLPMKDSELICELAGFDCSLLLQDKMYEKWIGENPNSNEAKKWNIKEDK